MLRWLGPMMQRPEARYRCHALDATAAAPEFWDVNQIRPGRESGCVVLPLSGIISANRR